MIIYILSDTHGHVDGFLDKLDEIGRPDRIFFLGDCVEDGELIRDRLDIDTTIVRGNNDYHNKIYRDEEVVIIEDYKILLTHGHLYDVNFDISNIYYRAEELGCDIVFFGHTHRPLKVNDRLLILNPGSVSYPRGLGNEKTFIKLIIEDGLKYEFIKL